MRVLDFLKVFDATLKAIYYMSNSNEEEFLWKGYIQDTPWWIAELELNDEREKETGFKPIEYRCDIEEGKPGFIVVVKE